MAMRNTSDKARQHDLIMAALTGDEEVFVADGCLDNINGIPTKKDLDEYDEAIADCIGMLEYALEMGDENEIRSWRRMLQQTKTEKKHAIRLMKQYAKEDVAA